MLAQQDQALLKQRHHPSIPGLFSRRAFGGQQLSLMFSHQRVDDFVEGLTFDDLRKLVERQINAVIGHAQPRKGYTAK